MKLNAATRLVAVASRLKFTSLEEFKKSAATKGFRVKKTTKTKYNTYYQAIDKVKGIVGFFNDFQEGSGKTPYGELEE